METPATAAHRARCPIDLANPPLDRALKTHPACSVCLASVTFARKTRRSYLLFFNAASFCSRIRSCASSLIRCLVRSLTPARCWIARSASCFRSASSRFRRSSTCFFFSAWALRAARDLAAWTLRRLASATSSAYCGVPL